MLRKLRDSGGRSRATGHLRAGLVPEDHDRALDDGSGRVDHPNRQVPPSRRGGARQHQQSCCSHQISPSISHLRTGIGLPQRAGGTQRDRAAPAQETRPDQPSGWGVDSAGDCGLGRGSGRRIMPPRPIGRQRAELERHSRQQRHCCCEGGQIRGLGIPNGLRVIAAAAASNAALRAGPGRAARSMTRYRWSRRPRLVFRRRLHRALPAALSGRRVQAAARLPRRESGPNRLPRKQSDRQEQQCGSEHAGVTHTAQPRLRIHLSRRALMRDSTEVCEPVTGALTGRSGTFVLCVGLHRTHPTAARTGNVRCPRIQ